MVIPVFDGEIDAYWWILCIEKYFKQWRTPESMKMIVVALAMKGPSLTWWLRWHSRHPSVNWDTFTAIFLWHFKSEWRVILPILDDEDDLELELQQAMQGGGVNEQPTAVEAGSKAFNQLSPSSIVADLEIAVSIKDDLVQTPNQAEIPFNNESRQLFSEPSKHVDDDNMTQNSIPLFWPSPIETTVASKLPPPKPPEADHVWMRNASPPKAIIATTQSFEDQSITDDAVAKSQPPPEPPDKDSLTTLFHITTMTSKRPWKQDNSGNCNGDDHNRCKVKRISGSRRIETDFHSVKNYETALIIEVSFPLTTTLDIINNCNLIYEKLVFSYPTLRPRRMNIPTQMVVFNFHQHNSFNFNTIMNTYSQLNILSGAQKLFDTWPLRNKINWSHLGFMYIPPRIYLVLVFYFSKSYSTNPTKLIFVIKDGIQWDGLNHVLHLYGFSIKSVYVQHVCGGRYLVDLCTTLCCSNEASLPIDGYVSKTSPRDNGFVSWIAIDMVVSMINACVDHYFGVTCEGGLFLDKEWILDKIANTCIFLHNNFTDHEKGVGEACLSTINYTPKVQISVQKNYTCVLFHDNISIAALDMMRINGVAYIKEFDSIVSVDIHVLLNLYEDFSLVLFDMCDIGPWTLIDPIINLYKYFAVMDYKPQTNSLYEDVIVYMSFCVDPEQLNSLNQQIMEYGTRDNCQNVESKNSVGTWMAHSGYTYYNAADWHIAWVWKAIGCISSTQRQYSSIAQHFQFKQWDPGGYFLIHWKDPLDLGMMCNNATTSKAIMRMKSLGWVEISSSDLDKSFIELQRVIPIANNSSFQSIREEKVVHAKSDQQ